MTVFPVGRNTNGQYLPDRGIYMTLDDFCDPKIILEDYS